MRDLDEIKRGIMHAAELFLIDLPIEKKHLIKSVDVTAFGSSAIALAGIDRDCNDVDIFFDIQLDSQILNNELHQLLEDNGCSKSKCSDEALYFYEKLSLCRHDLENLMLLDGIECDISINKKLTDITDYNLIFDKTDDFKIVSAEVFDSVLIIGRAFPLEHIFCSKMVNRTR